ncbi:MAG: Serine phosphatase RsbU, regulator of sigma subunit [Candidatus Ozemobacter sibiricus]|uniref:Serine phosphatase RsbU, regulator of sigma subunit n=1 Tax=Candidatus Ozemobacter sibiricus TaxID=2268124 RepID=A0A367ZRY7_9BACT|nr:MAG: Serine phosphatase RsbU, regulator of sigma subunit [Candidatus Ozemobacter sibiricus]
MGHRLPLWLAAALLAGLPVVLLFLAGDRTLAREFQRARDEAVVPLEEFRSHLQIGTRFEPILEGLGEKIMTGARHSRDPLMHLHQELTALQRAIPDTFEFVLFDHDSRLVASLSDLPEHHDALARFGLARRQLWENVPEPMARQFHAFRAFLGPFMSYRLDLFHRHHGTPSAFERRRGFVYLSSPRLDGPWFMLWVSFPNDVRELSFRLRTLLRDLPTPDAVLGSIDLRQPLDRQIAAMASAPPSLERALRLMGNEEDDCLFHEGWIWTQAAMSPTRRLVIGRPDHALAAWERGRRRLMAALLALFGAVTILWRWWLAQAGAWSLRTKLIVLFLYTSGMPLGLLAVAARGLLEDRQALLVRQRFERHEATLREFPRTVAHRLSLYEAVIDRSLAGPLPAGPAAHATAVRRARRLLRRVQPDLCALFDDRGHNLVRHVSGYDREVEPIIPIFGMHARRRAAQINGVEPDLQDSTRDQAMRATLEAMGIDLEPFTASLEEHPGHFTWTAFAKSVAYYLGFPLWDQAGKLRGSVFVLWGRDYIFKRLPQMLAAFARRTREITIGTYYFKGWLPPDFPCQSKAESLTPLAWRQSTAVHGAQPTGSATVLLTAILVPELEDQIMLAASDDTGIRAGLRRLAGRFGLAALAMALLGLGLGLWLTQHFLRPLGRFGEGLAAIRRRDFRIRLPVESDDEFGRLASTFNTVLEGMADLEVARIVQETFFPRTGLLAHGCSVFGSTLSASRVGGDYFDYLALPDGRWLLVIGDVTGHGVAASLGVAMAKAIICHPATPLERPSAMLALLNDMVIRTIAAKRMMTCFLAIFDPATRRLIASNAAHNFPWLVRAGAGAEHLAIRHPMLGIKTRLPFEDREIVLDPGDWLCLYTDGLIEAAGHDGQPIGYEAFRDALPGLWRGDARATHDAIRAWHAARRADPALADDATLVVLAVPPA